MKSQRRQPGTVLILISIILLLSGRIWAQARSGCGVPQLPASTEPNFFNDEQQVLLGDVMADIMADRVESIDDPELTGYLQQMGERIVRHLPASHLSYRFYLADLPVANAFSMSGGRVYVTRKLVARARTEDELAGVVGHELGHIITHQEATEWTAYMRKALGATAVTDRKDIEEKVERVYDLASQGKLAGVFGNRERDQQEADRVGMEAVQMAGYRPEGLAEFFDRVFENKGKKGSWLSELFNTTAPEPKRYREMLKLLPTLPANCTEARPANAVAEFQEWQKKVAAYRGTGRRESVHEVVLKRELEPALQDEFSNLRFSPDGKYVLAQDSGTVWVLRREPLEELFQIAAPNAYPAMFSADSSEVLVYDQAMRIERWGIQSQVRSDVYEVSTADGCVNFAVAPDGKTLACIEPKPGKGWAREFDLLLIDTESNTPFFERHNVSTPRMVIGGGFSVTFSWSMGFSPDGRYFVAAGDKPVAYDLKTRNELAVKGALAEVLGRPFTFLGPDLLETTVGAGQGKSRVVRFPSAEAVNVIDTGIAQVSAVTHGDYLLLRPIKDYAVGVLDIKQNRLVRANKIRALDVYDDTYVSEMGNGEIGLFRNSATPVASLKLPRGRLGRLQAEAVSPDLHWLALSEAGRGAVWDLTTGAQLYNLKGFQGSNFGRDGSLYVDFPKQEKTSRNIVRLGLTTRGMGLAQAVGEDEAATEHGELLTVVRPIDSGKPLLEKAKMQSEEIAKALGNLGEARRVDVLQGRQQHVILEVKDIETGKLLWSRRFEHEKPWIDYQPGSMVLAWHYEDQGLKELLPSVPEMMRLHAKAGDYLLEVVGATDGKARGWVLVDSAKRHWRLMGTLAVGERVFVNDTGGRALVYSLKDGSLAGRVYGWLVGVAPGGDQFCVEPKRGQLVLYDAATLNKVDEFDFSRPVSAAEFRGKILLVLTADQTVYELGVK